MIPTAPYSAGDIINDEVDPHHQGQRELNGVDTCDHVAGQTHRNAYETQQRQPGDWEVLVGQRPIAIHALEHLGTTDPGVVMLRRLLREAVRGENHSAWPDRHFTEATRLSTSVQDTTLKVPIRRSSDDQEVLRRYGAAVTDVILESAGLSTVERRARIEARVLLERQISAGA